MNSYATRETGVKRNKTEHKVSVVSLKSTWWCCVLEVIHISLFYTKNTQPFLIVSRAGSTSIHHVKIQKSWNPLCLVYWMAGDYIPSSDHHMHSVNTESHRQEKRKQFSKSAFNLKSETRRKVKCAIYIYIYLYISPNDLSVSTAVIMYTVFIIPSLEAICQNKTVTYHMWVLW